MKKHLIKWLNHVKLREKLIITFVIVVLVPIILVGFMLTKELRFIALDQSHEDAYQNNQRVIERMHELFRIPTIISTSLELDHDLEDIVNTQYSSTYEVVEKYNQFRSFQHLSNQREVSSIRFYIDNPTMINNWEFIPVDQRIQNEAWYQEVTDDVGYSRWKVINDETNKNEPFLSLIRRINFLENQTFGTLVVSIDPSQVQSILNQESLLMLLVDEEGSVISSNQSTYVDRHMSEFIDTDLLRDQGISEALFNSKPAQLSINQLTPLQSQNELTLISVTYNDQIVAKANQLSFLGTGVTFIGATVAVFFIVIVSKLLTQRLSHLSNKIEQVAAGDLDTTVVIDGTDEISQLSLRFNEMVDNLREMIEHVKLANEQKNLIELKQNEMKFKMLASQINPHFLFNTLESIRMKAHMNGDREVASVVKQLSFIIRKSLETEGKPIALTSEMDIVQDYLAIQSFRYGDRLRYELNIHSSAEKEFIQPLTIQPIVENAVYHGLEPSEEGGKITVSIYPIENGLLIKVQDTGVGISESRLREINDMISGNDTNGFTRIGLMNVHQRLQLMYGPQAGLSMESKQGVGTTVQFTIPRGNME